MQPLKDLVLVLSCCDCVCYVYIFPQAMRRSRKKQKQRHAYLLLLLLLLLWPLCVGVCVAMAMEKGHYCICFRICHVSCFALFPKLPRYKTMSVIICENSTPFSLRRATEASGSESANEKCRPGR